MSATPKFKVYNRNNEYIAACKYVEDAIAICFVNGDGTSIRYGHNKKVWTEGENQFASDEGYDAVSAIIMKRL